MRLPHEPAFTVESLAITHAARPSIVPTPVTTPSAGSSASSTFAKAPPRRTSRDRRAAQCARGRTASVCSEFFWWYFAAPPLETVAIFSFSFSSCDMRRLSCEEGFVGAPA